MTPPASSLHVVDLAPGAGLVRAGRVALDGVATLLLAPAVVGVLFTGLFTLAFALARVAGALLARSDLADSDLAAMLVTLGTAPLAVLLGSIAAAALVVALLVIVILAARTPRLWGLAAVGLAAAAVVDLAAGQPRTELTWSLAIVRFVFTWGLAAATGAAIVLLAAALVARQRTPDGRAVQRWPRFAVSMFVARYGANAGAFVRSLVRSGLRFVVTASAAAVVFAGTIVGVGFATQSALTRFTSVDPIDFIHVLYAVTTLAGLTIAAGGLRSAVRSASTRGLDLAVAACGLFLAGEMAAHLYNDIEIMRLGEGPWFPAYVHDGMMSAFSVTERELQVLNSVSLTWIFRGLISRLFVRGYGDLRQASARTARDLSLRRQEPPVLFLRSFMDDEQIVASNDARVGYAFGVSPDRIRLEEIVAHVMFPKGPLVALANPAVPAAPIGAARDVAADADWQHKVSTYLDASQAVVCFLGRTESFRWEIDRILAGGSLDRMMIVLPPTYPADRLLVRDAPRLGALMGLGDEADERERLAGVRVLAYDARAGGFLAVRASRADALAYREAMVLGAVTIARNAARAA